MCVVQQDLTNFFLSEGAFWTSDLNQAAEFKSIHEAIAFREECSAWDSHVLVYRDRRIYRINVDGASHATPVALA